MAGYVLYGRLETGSAAAEAALAEAGAVFGLREVPGGEEAARASGFLAVNPRGQVPALVHPSGVVITEGPAILLHIADAFPAAGLAPRPGSPERARHDRWLCFLHANCYEGELRRFYPDRYTTDPGGVEGVRAAAEEYVKRHYLLLESENAPAPYLFGDQPTVLDLYLWMLLQWTERDWTATHCPALLRLVDAAAARPKVAPVQARHFG
ncbi:MAG: glutathione S-transferase family protein [Paracoccaceae bacterium]